MPGPLARLLGMGRYQAAIEDSLTAAASYMPAQVGVAPPPAFHESSSLQSIVWADLTGHEGPLSRSAVIAIPTVARQRHLLCGTVARCPLRAIDGPSNTAVPTPAWASRTDGQVSPYHRMLWTVDDLLFHGWSVWRTTRGWAAPGTVGPLLTVDRIPTERWTTDVGGRLVVDGELVADDEVILIPGPHEGILNFGGPALRRTVANLDAASNAARNPSAYLELHYTGDEDLTNDEIDAHRRRWAEARRGEFGGVAWTNKVLEVREHGTHESALLIEGRNADSVDVSRLVSSPAAMADATNAGASLTYETTAGRNAEFIDYGVGLYMDAIAARLSMDDVVPRGQRIAFDTDELRTVTPSPTDSQTDD